MKILFVEDESVTKIPVLVHFRRIGMDLIFAENGRQALLQIDLFQPDIVVTDITMPIMNGIELSKKIRQKYGQSLPIVFISAHPQAEWQKEIDELGVIGYFTKPYNLKDISDFLAHNEEVNRSHELRGSD
ncbi:MAG: response regulator [Acidiferrobacterales bacterium]|nr:response regulator [Acidiferrobacterales bacterium]